MTTEKKFSGGCLNCSFETIDRAELKAHNCVETIDKVFIYICGNCKANKQPHERIATGEANDRICPTCGEWSVFYYEKEMN